METLTEEDLQTIARVKRNLRFWRYGRWIQVAIGISLVVLGLRDSADYQEFAFISFLPQNIACVIGGLLAGNAITEPLTKERKLLLKLSKSS